MVRGTRTMVEGTRTMVEGLASITSDTVFFVQRTVGSYQSAMTRINVTVVDVSYFAIPTAFTPNGDGKNDVLRVHVIGYIKLKSYRLFNRYGQMIFETSTIGKGWDGKINGVLQETDNFVWVAEGEDISGNTIKHKGNVVLIR